MKILDKKEINKEKSEQERKEVSNALSLARKTDAIRELMSTEEANLRKFRDQSLKRVQEELAPLVERHALLKKEVVELEERRKEALVPLDSYKKELEEKEIELSDVSSKIDIRLKELTSYEVKLYEREKGIKLDEEMAEQTKKRAEYTLSEAHTARTKAENALRDAEKVKSKADEYASGKIDDIVSRETQIQTWYKQLTLKEKTLEQRNKAQNDRERAINDKYETLLRTQKYVKRK